MNQHETIYSDETMTLKVVLPIRGGAAMCMRLERELEDMSTSVLNFVMRKDSGKRPEWCRLDKYVTEDELRRVDAALADYWLGV